MAIARHFVTTVEAGKIGHYDYKAPVSSPVYGRKTNISRLHHESTEGCDVLAV